METNTPLRPLILVVDDNHLIVECIAHHLERAAFDTLPAYGYTEALQLLEQHQPHIIILDTVLDDGLGYDLCRVIRAGEIDGTQVPLADTPILFLSARADEADRLEGFRAGADDYLTKPFSPQELIYRLQALIRRSQGQSYTCVDVGALHIDPSRQEVTAGTQAVPLTPKEFNLLYLLARRPGMVFSRVELLQRVWGYTFVGNTRTVDVHVNRVRRKLAHFDGAGIQLATAWSVGYKLLPTHDAAA